MIERLKQRVARFFKFNIENIDNSYDRLLRSKNLEIGHGTYGRPNIQVFNEASVNVTIGRYTSIANSVSFILGGKHVLGAISTYPFRFRDANGGPREVSVKSGIRSSVRIGSDVWLSSNVVVLDDVEIGSGAVIAANAVVVRDIPPYAVAAGIPAKVVRMRFEPETVKKLLDLEWWNWSVKEIEEIQHLLEGDDIDSLLNFAESRNDR